MNTLHRYLWASITITFLMSACSSLTMQTQPLAEEALQYGDVLGKSLNDLMVMDWLATNNCISTDQFQLCKEAGVAFWMDTDHVVKKIYLYLNNEDGITPYKGELPLKLKFYDTMGAVEYKIKKRMSADGLDVTQGTGASEEGFSPDHIRYWAIYKRYGITVIYNSPFADEDATIYAIVVNS